jgi:uncharacterized membrane protein YgcG
MDASPTPRAHARPVLLFLVAAAAVAVACSGKVTQAGGLEVQIAVQNLQVGTDFDTLRVVTAQEASPGGAWPSKTDYDGPVTESTFPTTIAIAAGSSPDQNVRVTVTALLGSTTVVQSEAQVTVPTSQVLELDMYLSRSCVNVTCTADQTSCVGGSCQGIVIPPSQLTQYAPGGPNGTGGGSSGSSSPDASMMSGSSGGGSSGSAGDSGGGPSCAACPGCCDLQSSGCVPVGGICTNGLACSGSKGTCSVPPSSCTPSQAASAQAACLGGGGCYSGGCGCMICPTGSTCAGGVCVASASDAGTGCSPATCSGCCDTNGGCFPTGAACASGGHCTGGAGAPCSTDTCSASSCPGCCTPAGGCVAPGSTCPNGRVCGAAGGTACVTTSCGQPGAPCCVGNVCESGTCNSGFCSTVAQNCSFSTEPQSGVSDLTADISGNGFAAVDGFVVLSGSTSGPMQAMFYFTDYANACGYAQPNSAKSGGHYITFGVSQTSGTGYASLIGSFVSGGANLGPALTTETPSGSSCSPEYLVSGQCGSGMLVIHITQASATQIVGSLSGSCSSPDSMSASSFTLPVCGTSLSVSGTSGCCP